MTTRMPAPRPSGWRAEPSSNSAVYTGLPFAELQGYLPGGGSFATLPHAEIVKRYRAFSEQALMTRFNRVRKRFGKCLASVIVDTVADPAPEEEQL